MFFASTSLATISWPLLDLSRSWVLQVRTKVSLSEKNWTPSPTAVLAGSVRSRTVGDSTSAKSKVSILSATASVVSSNVVRVAIPDPLSMGMKSVATVQSVADVDCPGSDFRAPGLRRRGGDEGCELFSLLGLASGNAGTIGRSLAISGVLPVAEEACGGDVLLKHLTTVCACLYCSWWVAELKNGCQQVCGIPG